MARDLKFRILKVEELYYQSSENKGADQLRGYREADLRLCFRICKTRFSHDAAQIADVSTEWSYGRFSMTAGNACDEYMSLVTRNHVFVVSDQVRLNIACSASVNMKSSACAKTKTQISCAVTAQLISAFVFASQIVQSLFCLNPKIQASSHFLPVCVIPGRKPRRPVFSQRGSFRHKKCHTI